jgi:hypothetical protein
MDISNLLASQTAEVHLEHPKLGKLYDDKGKAVVITVYGPSSDKFQELKRRDNVRVREIMRKRGSKFGISDLLEDDSDESKVDRLALLTVSISGLTENGKPVTDAKALYSNPGLGWIRQQVEDAIGGWEAFFTTP